MPHDRDGNLLVVGDKVNIPCIVTVIQQGDEYCNVSVETVEKMPPGNSVSNMTLNTKQVIKEAN